MAYVQMVMNRPHTLRTAFVLSMKVCSALLLAAIQPGCTKEAPSEASKWEKLLVDPSSISQDRWQESYVRFRDDQKDAASADEVRDYARKHPEDQNGLMAAAIVERDTERFDEAERLFREVIAKNPQRTGALWNLGRLALRKPNEDEAATFFEQAMRSDPKAWQPPYSLSLLRRQQGKKQESEELWKLAKSLGAGQLGERGGMEMYKVDLGKLLADLDWE